MEVIWMSMLEKKRPFRVRAYLWSELSADVVGIQGEDVLSGAHIQNPLVFCQGQHGVVPHPDSTKPRHTVMHIWRERKEMLFF